MRAKLPKNVSSIKQLANDLAITVGADVANAKRKRQFPVCGKLRLVFAACIIALGLLLLGENTQAQVTLNVVNNFAESLGGNYFGGHIENQDIALYFTGIGANDVTYTGSNGSTAVANESRVWLSDVTSGSFTLNSTINAGRVYAILGSSAPASVPSSGPAVTGTSVYSYIELTTLSGGKADQSFLNQVAFTTKLTNGTQQQSWAPSTTAQSIATAFNTAFPTAPYAPSTPSPSAPTTPSYNPYFATSVTRTAGSDTSAIDGYRIIGSSTNNIGGASVPSPTIQYGTAFTNVPSYNNYLGWLQNPSNAPAEGWKFGFNSAGSPNSTYVGYLTVTGTNNNYAIQLGNFTYGGTFEANGTMTGGTTVNGTISYAANNSVLYNLFGSNEEYTGNWTDMVLFSGAINPTGSVTSNGSLGTLDQASVLYTVGASMAAGILGSDLYAANSSNTDYFFKDGLTPSNMLGSFFANSQFGGSAQSGFYDKFWYSMLQAGGVHDGIYAGYFMPYDDHFTELNPLMASDTGTLTWELGTAPAVAPEPSTISLLLLAGIAFLYWRRRQRSLRNILTSGANK